MILDLACGQLIEKFPGAFYFGLLDRTQVQAFHCPFGLSYEVNVFYRTFIKGNRPVRRVVPNWSWNGKAFRQLGIDTDFIGFVHIFRKAAFWASLGKTDTKLST